MNIIAITGRLTKDIELSKTSSGIMFAKFNVAVPSEMKDSNGERQSDFFPCIAWRENAEKIQNYFHKGNAIELFGSMNSRTFTNKDGYNQLFWEFTVKGWGFPQFKDEQESSDDKKEIKSKKESQTGLTSIDDSEEDLPF